VMTGSPGIAYYSRQLGVSAINYRALIKANRRQIKTLIEPSKSKDLQTCNYKDIPLWELTAITRASHKLKAKNASDKSCIESILGLAPAFESIISYFQPDVVTVWNGHNSKSRLLAHFAQKCGARVIFFEQGLLPRTMVMDPQGVNGCSFMCNEDWE